MPDDDSDPSLQSLLKGLRSSDTPASGSFECTELLAKLRQIPNVVHEQTQVAVEELSEFSSLPFRQIGQYELLERIAGGGMGEVFKARHQRLGNVVAIKLLHRDKVVDRHLLDRFEQEMQAVGRLSHEHIVKPLYADEEDGVPYLVLEYVEGQTLAELLDQYTAAGEQFPIALACESIRQAAIGLAHAHQHGIIHRDIKPSNLMLSGANAFRSRSSRSRETSDADARTLTSSATEQSPVIKILDLGLARLNDSASDDNTSRKKELTREGQVMGTPDYMAPEQLENSRLVDGRTDIYALGATLFKLLTARVPHSDADDGSLTAKLMAIASKPIPSVSQFRTDVPPELDAIVQRMLSKSRNDRPQSAMEVAEALRPFAGTKVDGTRLSADLVERVAAPNPPSPRWSTSMRWIMSLVAVGLVVALGLLVRELTDRNTANRNSEHFSTTSTRPANLDPVRVAKDLDSSSTLPESKGDAPPRRPGLLFDGAQSYVLVHGLKYRGDPN